MLNAEFSAGTAHLKYWLKDAILMSEESEEGHNFY